MLPIRLASALLATLTIAGPAASVAPIKHWRRTSARGAFNVDAYAYNKPVMNLVEHLPRSGQALPMDQVLDQIAHTSRARVAHETHYRNLDTDMQSPDMALARIQGHHPQVYSHEFQVKDKGKRKFVLINRLDKVSDVKPSEFEEPHQPGALNANLALPEPAEALDMATHGPSQSDAGQLLTDSAAISPLKGESETGAETETESVSESATESVADDATTIGMSSTTATEEQTQKQPEKPEQSPVDAAKKRDSKNGNDGPANGMNVSGTEAGIGATLDKPLRVKSKRKHTKTRAQTKTKTTTRTPNETDPKPSAAAPAAAGGAGGAGGAAGAGNHHQLMAGQTTDVKATATMLKQTANKVGQMAGKGSKRRGTQRRPTPADEQEIETATNWWQILPYAEIRKFLNTIYDSFADEADDERAQRI